MLTRKRVIAAAFAVAFLTFVVPTHAEVLKPGPIVIEDSPGGDVDNFIAFYTAIKQSGVPVILRGICMSACGLVLMLPHDQVCVESTASIGFHQASDLDGPLPAYTAAVIRRYFPPAVQEWLADKKLTEAMIYMDAATMVKLGIFPACAPPKIND